MRLSQVESAAKATPQVRLDEVDRERWHKWMADIVSVLYNNNPYCRDEVL